MNHAQRIRVLIELTEDNPIFDHAPDAEVAAEAIYADWLRPIVATQLGGARIVALETEYALSGDEGYPNFLPWGEP